MKKMNGMAGKRTSDSAHTAHLNEAEIDAVLMGDAQTGSVAHLKACSDCRAQVALLGAPIEDFVAVTLAWGERRSAMLAAQSAHLNEAEMETVLVGDALPASVTHLKGCVACQTQVARMAGPIKDFAAVTLEWSERRSATLAAPSTGLTAGWARQGGWAVVASVLLAAAVLLPAFEHRSFNTQTATSAHAVKVSPATPVLTASVQRPQPIHEARIAAARIEEQMAMEQAAAAPAARRQNHTELDRDNRMLEAIDDEWDAAPPSPAESFGLRIASGSDAQAHFAPL
jgi:hypothetical protein